MRAPSELSSLVSRSCLILALGLGLGGCKMKASESAAPMEPGADMARAEDPLLRLEQLEGEMRAYGLQPTARGRTTTAGGDLDSADASGGAATGEAEAGEGESVAPDPELAEDSAEAAPAAAAEVNVDVSAKQQRSRDREAQQRCDNLCSLNEAICELESSICSLAQDHGEDPTYADACERASDDCTISSEACDACEA